MPDTEIITISKSHKVEPLAPSKRKSKRVRTRRGLLKNETKEFFSNITIHGFSNIVRSHNIFITFLWIVVLTLSATYTSYRRFFRLHFLISIF
jgi:hypothetical protein